MATHSFVNTQDVKIVMSKSTPNASGKDVTGLAASAATPSILTTGTIPVNSIVYVDECHALAPLGRGWYLMSKNATELTGSDAAGGTVKAGETFAAKTWVESDLVEVCASSVDISRASASFIDAPTFCNRTQAVKSAVVEFGTVTISGYIDIASATYDELHKAYQDKADRFFGVLMGTSLAKAIASKNNLVAMKGTVSSIDFEVPVDGAIGFTAEIKLSSPVQHII